MDMKIMAKLVTTVTEDQKGKANWAFCLMN
jgi:hypothetical protein